MTPEGVRVSWISTGVEMFSIAQQHHLLQSMKEVFLHILRVFTVVRHIRRTLRSKLSISGA